MKLMVKVSAILISAGSLLLTTTASFTKGGSDERIGIRFDRVFIHSQALYAQGSDDSNHGGTVFRLSLDNLDVVERLQFPVTSSSKRFGPLMRISGTDIYLLSVSDMGGAQIVAGIEKFSFNDLIQGAGDYLLPASSVGRNNLSKRQYIDVAPLKDALINYHVPALSTARRTDPGGRIQLWFDLTIPGDGFRYLYILNDKGLSVWKRDLSSTEPWQLNQTIADIPPEPFCVANDGNSPFIITASGKIYRLLGQSLRKIASSFTPLATAPTGITGPAMPTDSTTVFIDDLDSGEQWSLSLDRAGKALTMTHHLKRGSLVSEELPDNLSNALQKILQLAKASKRS